MSNLSFFIDVPISSSSVSASLVAHMRSLENLDALKSGSRYDSKSSRSAMKIENGEI